MLPTGTLRLPFYDWEGKQRKDGTLLCEVVVMMVAFTTGNCRVRGTILEAGLGREVGETFGNKETPLTPDLLAIIRS